MKKLLFITLFSCFIGISQAQNFQVLNGIGSDKSYVNFFTAELYKPMGHGTFYGFSDVKLNKNGYFDTYTELFGYLNINKKGLSVTGQVNAGLFELEGAGIQIYPVYLVGLSKAGSLGNWNLTLDVLYRMDQGLNLDGVKVGQGAQLTGTFLRDGEHFQISGYCDLYQTENSECYNKNGNSLIVQFEPQAWWKFSKRVYLGVECRVSNFTDPNLGLYNYSSYAMVGLKWNLE